MLGCWDGNVLVHVPARGTCKIFNWYLHYSTTSAKAAPHSSLSNNFTTWTSVLIYTPKKTPMGFSLQSCGSALKEKAKKASFYWWEWNILSGRWNSSWNNLAHGKGSNSTKIIKNIRTNVIGRKNYLLIYFYLKLKIEKPGKKEKKNFTVLLSIV